MRKLEQNLAVMWSNSVRRFKKKECLRVKKDGEWKSLTYAQVDEFVKNFALGLIDMGFKQGDRIALLSENRPKWAFTDLAVQAVGGVLAAIYSTNTPKEILHIIENSESRFLVVSNHFQLKKALAVKKLDELVEHIVIFDPIQDLTDVDKRVVSFHDVLNLGKGCRDAGILARRLEKIQPEDVATLIYTSGVTGKSKGAMITHSNLLSNIHEAHKLFGLSPDDICLSILPLSHSFERMAGHFAVFYCGASIAYAESISTVGHDLLDVRPTVMVGVPRLFEKFHARILQHLRKRKAWANNIFDWAMAVGKQATSYRLKRKRLPAYLDLQIQAADRLVLKKIRGNFGGRLRFAISGGAPLPQEIAEFFYAASVPIYEGYGLTEASPVISANCPAATRLGTVGRPIPGVEVCIAGDGEILVQGPNVMKGYYNNPVESDIVIKDGWLHTGDIGRFDDTGFLTITDRKKDIIMTSGGKNIAPQHIEALLRMDPYISQVFVVGDRRPYLTSVIVPDFTEVKNWIREKGMFFASNKDLVRDPSVRDLIQASVDKVNAQLARFETVKKFILSDTDFNVENEMLTPTMKLRRRHVIKRFSHEIDQLY
jgi:long-chain acyl-CoA synthetase